MSCGVTCYSPFKLFQLSYRLFENSTGGCANNAKVMDLNPGMIKCKTGTNSKSLSMQASTKSIKALYDIA